MYQSPHGHSCHVVALEGGDRLGKSTQAKLLENALEQVKIKAILDKSPYKDGVTYERIYEMLESGEAVRHPVVFQTMFGANRRFFQQRFLPTLARHFEVVVLDRWSLSGRIYGGESGVSKADTECLLSGLLEPDLTFVFDGVPFPTEGGDDSYEADTAFQSRVRDRYRRWAEKHPETTVLVDAHGAPQVICEEIVSTIQRHLGR